MIKKIKLENHWRLIQEERQLDLPVSIPTTVFEALIENNVIDDPFHGLNEKKVSWVHESSWKYRTMFRIDDDIYSHDNVLLQFNGLDTIAEIHLNGEMIGKANNMFMVHEFNVKDHLVTGDNHLEVVFHSPTKTAKALMKKNRIYLGQPFSKVALPGVSYLRKAQYSFGWDWGPKLPDVGIFKPVQLVCFDAVRIRSTNIRQEFHYNKDPLSNLKSNDFQGLKVQRVKLKVGIELDLSIPTDSLVNANLKSRVELVTTDGKSYRDECQIRSSDLEVEFTIENPVLWWTHDLGEPNLHDLKVTVFKDEEIIDKLDLKIGIRDIRLVREPDEWGETFFFMLNGVPIFARGANWIPVDSFIARGKKKGLYQQLLKDARKTNMNMIRVWGGGLYEDDVFYNLCDKIGLLVWQDFPFACAIYPTSKEFIENVTREAIQNIKRLRIHPSLALWCGNNEVEQLMGIYLGITCWASFFRYFKLVNKKEFISAYNNMFEEILPDLVRKHDKTRAYWPSSPSNGIENKKRGLINSNSPSTGDSHFWKVWHQGAPFSEYRKFYSRFMSEYGFESFPSMKTIASFCPKNQYRFNSPIMKNHQKNLAGNKLILRYIKRRFRIPAEFEKQVMLSQITQAEAIEYGIEHWRRNRTRFRCMGSLYWQLNDCWPVASWSSIDYYGRWKALNYIAKRAYEPIFPSVEESPRAVRFWITNDKVEPCSGKYEWVMMDSKGNKLGEREFDVDIQGCISKIVDEIKIAELTGNNPGLHDKIIFYRFKFMEKGKVKIHRGFKLFARPKDFPLVPPGLSWELEETNSEPDHGILFLTLKIHTTNIALYVYLDSTRLDFIASDNFFSMRPNELREITLELKIREDQTIQSLLDEFKSSFMLKSLHDLF
ncbi:MAG: beta-mannosidase [Promethearchaeota archaeon]